MALPLLIVFLAAAAAVPPQSPGGDTGKVVAAAQPTQVVAAFHAALAGGDRNAALSLLAPEVVIFEAGGAEVSREEYALHHLDADLELSRATRERLVEQRTGGEGGVAWVLSRTATSGNFRGQPVSSNVTETAILRRTATGWLIVHMHWSSQKSR
ncbi:MAG TPA: nuclear transport factor 2 family protein [Thermoanaerobaculia bacterium]|nr:nuclear transport factor 2 family protein [Thermoanaerobaculia bacterium]